MEADDAGCKLGHRGALDSLLSAAPRVGALTLGAVSPLGGACCPLPGAARLAVRCTRQTNLVTGRSLGSNVITLERCYPRLGAHQCRAWM